MEHFRPPDFLQGSRSPLRSLQAMEPLFASAGLGVWHLDLKTERLWWSRRTHEIHDVAPGYQPEKAAAIAFYAPLAQGLIMAAIDKAQADGTSWDLTLPLITARGTPIIMRASGLALTYDGQPQHLLGICEDLTERTMKAEEHGRLALVVKQMTNAALIADRDGRTIWVNSAFEQMTGYDVTDFIGKKPGTVLQGPGTCPETSRAIGSALRAGRPFHGEILNYRRDGRPYWIELEISPIRGAAGEITGFVAIESNIDARKQAEAIAARELDTRREAETLLRDILDAVPTAISAYDRDNRLLVVNRMKQEIFPRHADLLTPGMPLAEVLRSWFHIEEGVDPASAVIDRRVAGLLAAANEGIAPYESKLQDGRWLLSAARRSASGNLIWVRTDITPVKLAELEARERASRDPLTGLLNRTGFFSSFRGLQRQLAQGVARGCLAVLDIDHFKWVNDVYGHAAGDSLLQTIARRLGKGIRRTDLATRLGGDEFALYLPDVSEAEARRRLDALRRGLSRGTRIGHSRLQPSVSMGFAMLTPADEGCEDAMRRADRALYEAKRTGRARTVLYTDRLADEISVQRRMAERLRRALGKDRIEVAFQPQLRLKDDCVASFEALARWKDGSQWVPPLEFVEAAEANGLAERLGQAVLRQALAACRHLRDASGRPVVMAVNVGTSQLQSESFADQVEAALQEAGLPPTALELEITETVLLDRSIARIGRALTRLRASGVRLSLDDFGTGHASLSHLDTLPIDCLKIDRSFVSAIGVDRRRELIARTIVGLARGLELDCVAEGVETDAQRRFLEGHGCSHIQGYLIGRPMSLDQALTLLQSSAAPAAGVECRPRRRLRMGARAA